MFFAVLTMVFLMITAIYSHFKGFSYIGTVVGALKYETRIIRVIYKKIKAHLLNIWRIIDEKNIYYFLKTNTLWSGKVTRLKKGSYVFFQNMFYMAFSIVKVCIYFIRAIMFLFFSVIKTVQHYIFHVFISLCNLLTKRFVSYMKIIAKLYRYSTFILNWVIMRTHALFDSFEKGKELIVFDV